MKPQSTAKLYYRLACALTHLPWSWQRTLADTVAWLLGPFSTYLSGAVVPLDGGECAR